jgi:hypothetical protein
VRRLRDDRRRGGVDGPSGGPSQSLPVCSNCAVSIVSLAIDRWTSALTWLVGGHTAFVTAGPVGAGAVAGVRVAGRGATPLLGAGAVAGVRGTGRGATPLLGAGAVAGVRVAGRGATELLGAGAVAGVRATGRGATELLGAVAGLFATVLVAVAVLDGTGAGTRGRPAAASAPLALPRTRSAISASGRQRRPISALRQHSPRRCWCVRARTMSRRTASKSARSTSGNSVMPLLLGVVRFGATWPARD